MSNIQTVKAQIQSLIDLANTTTSRQDTNLTDGVNALVGGYGQGGSGGGSASLNIHYGDTEPSDTSMLWCKCDTPTSVLGKTNIDSTESINANGVNLPSAFGYMGVGVVGTKVYLFGGMGNGGYSKTINVLDIETNTITTLSAAMPTNSYGFMGVGVVGTKIYLFGGHNGGSYSNAINVFDTKTETMTTLSVTLPMVATEMGVGVVGTKIYLFGGRKGSASSSNSFMNSINVFDTESETISTLPITIPTIASEIGVGVVGTKIYLLGGHNKSGALSTINVFDTESETISTLSSTLPTSIYSMGYGTVGAKIYLFGGYASSTTNTITVFDTESETISVLSSTLPTSVHAMGSGTAGAKIYLFGGNNGSSYVATINVFSASFELKKNTLLFKTSLTNNIFNIVDGIELGVTNVYIGNANGYGEEVEAYLYQNEAWTQI